MRLEVEWVSKGGKTVVGACTIYNRQISPVTVMRVTTSSPDQPMRLKFFFLQRRCL